MDGFELLLEELVPIPVKESAFEGFQTLHCLRHLSFDMPEFNIPVQWLVAALRLSPNIAELSLGAAMARDVSSAVAGGKAEVVTGVDCECDLANIDAVVYIDQRLQAGLEVTGHVTDSRREPKHLALHLHMMDEDTDLEGYEALEEEAEEVVCSFLDALPVCGAITSVAVTIMPFQSDTCRNSDGSSLDPANEGEEDDDEDDGWKTVDEEEEEEEEGGELGSEEERQVTELEALFWLGTETLPRGQRGRADDEETEEGESCGADGLSSGDGDADGQAHGRSSIPRSLARAFPGLQSLHMSVGLKSECSLTDMQLFTELESLTLAHLKQLTSNAVGTLCKLLPGARELSIVNCRLVGDTYLNTGF